MRASFDDGSTQAEVEFEIDGEKPVLAPGRSHRSRTVGKSLVGNAWSELFAGYRLFDRIRYQLRRTLTVWFVGNPEVEN